MRREHRGPSWPLWHIYGTATGSWSGLGQAASPVANSSACCRTSSTACSARVSTPEVTALDVATDPDLAGGIDNSATVIIELAENDAFDATTLASLTTRFPAASGRRVGYVLEHFTDHADLATLHEAVADRSSSPSRLDPTRPAAGPVDERWNLYLNRGPEPEA